MKSIFDGWTKKVEHVPTDGKGGFCANGFMFIKLRMLDKEWRPISERIGRWIQQNMEVPERHATLSGVYSPALYPSHATIWANNEKKLDIEGFKMVDLLTQGFVPEEAAEVKEVEEVKL